MERRGSFLILLFGLCFLPGRAQVYDAGFIKPMDLPFNLAGSFGEPRPDHFHSGIDIKTNEQEGYAVAAIGDGYVSRIKVSPYGYGKAIYITHPNGYTSVYGHLSAFHGKLETYVHQQHYQKQRSEFDLYPAAGLFTVKQGDTIAYSGNTGGSGGPHLHFEIRDSKTEHALNPLDFYPKNFYEDTIPPEFHQVKVYQMHEDMRGIYEAHTRILPLKRTGNTYTTESPIGIAANASIYISLEGFDKQDDSKNQNGISMVEMLNDEDTVFRYRVNEIDFDNTRMCNAFVDYAEMVSGNGYFYNCYRLKRNLLPFYAGSGDGQLHFDNDRPDTIPVRVYAFDHNHNRTTVNLKFYREDEYFRPFFQEENFSHIQADKADSVSAGPFRMLFPAGSFYDNTTVVLSQPEADQYEVAGFGTIVPLQKSGRVEFGTPLKKQRDKAVIVRRDDRGEETALKTTYDKAKYYAESKALGTFYLRYDTVKPIIQKEVTDETGIRVHSRDDLSGISSYNGYIDGRWVNFYYDAKNDHLTYAFDEYCPPGEHKLKLVVTDAAGNSAIFTKTFKR